MYNHVILSLALAAGLVIAEFAVPSGIKTCADDQPNVAECRRQALQEAVPLLANGWPQIGASSIDPLDHLPPLVWHSNTRGFDLKFHLEDSRFTGLSHAIVDDLKVDTWNHQIRVITHIDSTFSFEGSYTLVGNVLGVPMDGQGLFKLNMVGSGVDVTYAGHPVSGADGKSYLHVDSVTVKMSFGDTQYELTGIFGDYPPLVHAGNTFINNVASTVIQPAILPALEKWLAGIFLQRAQSVFSTVPYEQLFPKTSANTGFYRAVYPYYQ